MSPTNKDTTEKEEWQKAIRNEVYNAVQYGLCVAMLVGTTYLVGKLLDKQPIFHHNNMNIGQSVLKDTTLSKGMKLQLLEALFK
jgi:hypothetical protein